MKHIVLCLDGTTITFGSGPPTNVLLLFRLLDRSNVCYYQPGVGTLFTGRPDIVPHTSLYTSWQATQAKADAALGYSLSTHVQAAYLFLVRFYSPGDKIIIFGFSRGSFTARVLAGMLEHTWLLRRGLEDMVRTAWELYAGWEVAGQPIGSRRQWLLEEFRSTFCRPVRIHFMGLWDTVSLVGWTRERVFPFSTRSSVVSHLRHAISVDERRCKYRVEPFEPLEPSPDPLSWWRQIFGPRAASGFSEDLEELWFPGNHSDVGGGWCEDHYGYRISAIPFQWIVSEAIKHGVQFSPGAVATIRRECPVEQSLLLYHHDMLSLGASQFREPLNYDGDSELWRLTEGNLDRRPPLVAVAGQDSGQIVEREHMASVDLISPRALRARPAPNTNSSSILQGVGSGVKKKDIPKSQSYNSTGSDTFSGSTPLLRGRRSTSFAPNSTPQKDAGRATHRFGSSRRSELAKPSRAPPTQVPQRPSSTGSTWFFSKSRNVAARKGVYTWPSAKMTRLPSFSALIGLSSSPKHTWPMQDAEIVPVKRFNGRGSSSVFGALFWWLVECFPFSTDVERADGAWMRQVTPNLGAPRPIPKHAKFHWSVFYRLRMVSDYNPTNLPNDIGNQFLELVERVMEVPESLRAGIAGLNRDSIRASCSPIWNVIPDDLAPIEKRAVPKGKSGIKRN